MSGYTRLIDGNFKSYLGISNLDVISVELPKCNYIDVDTFTSCSSLTQVSIPECTYIGPRAFNSCSSLTQVSIPECTYIGQSAFKACVALTEVSLPKCTYIDVDAFGWCDTLSKVTIANSSFCSIGFQAFRYAPCSIYVPASLVDAYKSAEYWSAYSSQIFAIPE